MHKALEEMVCKKHTTSSKQWEESKDWNKFLWV